MKKIFLLFTLASIMAASVSCTKSQGPTASDGMVFKADFESEAVKSDVDLSNGTVNWEVGDAIYVTDGTNAETVVLTAADINGKYATIKTSLPAGAAAYYAYYPAGNVTGFSEGVFSVENPGLQENVSTKSAVAKSTSVDFTFKHIGCVFAFTCTNSDIACVKFFGNNDELCIPNTFKVNSENAQLSDISESGVATQVWNDEPGKTYYMEILPCELTSGFAIAAYDEYDVEIGRIFYSKSLSAGRNSVFNLGDLGEKIVQQADMYIRNAADLALFLEAAPEMTATQTAMIVCDIDMSGDTLATASSFAGTLEGKGKKIMNLDAGSKAFFSTLDGTVKNIVFDNCTTAKYFICKELNGTVDNVKVNSSSSFYYNGTAESGTELNYAFLVGTVETGTVSNCVVEGDMNFDTEQAGKIHVGGLVAVNASGLVTKCAMKGDVTVKVASGAESCSSVAGIVARAGKDGQSGQVLISDCVNDGKISFTHTGTNLQKMTVGGILGQTPSATHSSGTAMYDCGLIKDCTNNGEISYDYAAGGTGTYPGVGGIAGFIEGGIKSCKNYGKISVAVCQSKSAEDAVAVTCANIGGVAGYVSGDADDCHNYGALNIQGYFAGGTQYAQSAGSSASSVFGGCFGCAGPYTYSETALPDTKITNCTNNVALEINPKVVSSGSPNYNIGGIVGFSSNSLENCKNNSSVTVKSSAYMMYLAGVVGRCAGDVKNCDNAGSISYDGDQDNFNKAKPKQQAYTAGVVSYTDLKNLTISDCDNTGAVSMSNTYGPASDAVFHYVGGVFGQYGNSPISITNCTNNADVTSTVTSPARVGGVAASFNGTMTGCSNLGGKISIPSGTLISGKWSQAGALVGYANATINNCSTVGTVDNQVSGTSSSSFVGAAGKADKTWTGNTSNATVTGKAYKGSVTGSFGDGGSAGSYKITWKSGTIGGNCSSLNYVGYPNGNEVVVSK